MGSKDAVRGNAALILVPTVIFLLMLFLFRPFVIDDSYITFRYAQNLAGGGAISYNANDAQPVEGYTSFLWMLISAGAIAVGADPLAVVRLFSIAAGVGALLLIRMLAFRLLGNYLLSFLPALLLAVSAEFAMWTMAGLETTFFLFLLLLSMYLLDREIESGGRPWWGLSFALLALTRPEGAAFFGVAFAYRVAVRFVSRGKASAGWKPVVLAAFSFLIIYAPYWLWRFNYYDLLLPNSYYAKHRASEGAGYVRDFLVYHAPVVLLALAAPFMRSSRKPGAWKTRRWALLAWAVIVVNFAGVWNVMPAMAWDWRLFLHLSPLLFLMALRPLTHMAKRRNRTAKIATLVIAALLIAWSAHPELLPARIASSRATGDGLRAAHIEIGQLLKDKLSPGTLVVLVDTGAIAYFSGLPCLDIAGIPLNNPALAQGRFTEEDFWNTNPGAIVMHGDEEGRIAYQGIHRQILDHATENGFVRYASAMYKEDYYVWVFLHPSFLKEMSGGGGA